MVDDHHEDLYYRAAAFGKLRTTTMGGNTVSNWQLERGYLPISESA